MAKRVGVDKWLFGTVLLLVLFGLVIGVFGVGGDGEGDAGSPYAYVMKQAGVGAGWGWWRCCADAGGLRKYNNPK
jgi:cell division protein FtsW